MMRSHPPAPKFRRMNDKAARDARASLMREMYEDGATLARVVGQFEKG